MDHTLYAPSAWQAMGCAIRDIAGLTFDVETPDGQARASKWFRDVSASSDGDSVLDRLASSLAYHTDRLENWPTVRKFSGSIRAEVSSSEIPQEIWEDEASVGSAIAAGYPRTPRHAPQELAYAQCLRSMVFFNNVVEWRAGSVSPADLGFSGEDSSAHEQHAIHDSNFRNFLTGAADFLRKPSKSKFWAGRMTSDKGALTTICPYQKNAGYMVLAKNKSRGRIQYFYDNDVVLVNVFYGDTKTLHQAARLDDARQFSETLVHALGGEVDLALAAVESLKTTLDDPLGLGPVG